MEEVATSGGEAGSGIISIEQTSHPSGSVMADEEVWDSEGGDLRRADLNEGVREEGLALASEEGTNSRARGLSAEAMGRLGLNTLFLARSKGWGSKGRRHVRHRERRFTI